MREYFYIVYEKIRKKDESIYCIFENKNVNYT